MIETSSNTIAPPTTRPRWSSAVQHPAVAAQTRVVFSPSTVTRLRPAHEGGAEHRVDDQRHEAAMLVSTMINVMGRYLMKSPMIPGQNSSGAKAASVVSVEVMTGQADLAGALHGGLDAALALLHVAVDVLDDDDGVVDQHAQRQDQAEQHHHVQRDAQRLEDGEAHQHGQRDRQGDDQALRSAQEDHQHHHHQHQAGEDVVLQVRDHAADVLGLVHGHVELDAVGQLSRRHRAGP